MKKLKFEPLVIANRLCGGHHGDRFPLECATRYSRVY